MSEMKRGMRAGRALAALSATVLALTACGDAEDTAQNAADAGESSAPSTSATGSHEGHGHEGGHQGHDHSHGDGATGDPNATPAHEIEGAELAQGEFSPLASAPAGTESVNGTAWLARHDNGTTVTMEVSGLQPDVAYMSHLHAQPCAKDEGGPHFKFDAQGSEEPPNEVHIAFTANADGKATTTVTNDNRKSEGAKSIVLHLADKDGTKFACADF